MGQHVTELTLPIVSIPPTILIVVTCMCGGRATIDQGIMSCSSCGIKEWVRIKGVIITT